MATLHLEGEAHDWWFHGLTTLGHAGVIVYDDFTRRVLERIEGKNLEEYFGELTKLKQTWSSKTYLSEFLKVSVMVLDLLEPRRIFMFIDGLA